MIADGNMGMGDPNVNQPSKDNSGHGPMGTNHGSMGTMDKLANEQTTNAPSTTEQPQHHEMETTYSSEEYTYGKCH